MIWLSKNHMLQGTLVHVILMYCTCFIATAVETPLTVFGFEAFCFERLSIYDSNISQKECP
jgi:hypothetical protein